MVEASRGRYLKKTVRMKMEEKDPFSPQAFGTLLEKVIAGDKATTILGIQIEKTESFGKEFCQYYECGEELDAKSFQLARVREGGRFTNGQTDSNQARSLFCGIDRLVVTTAAMHALKEHQSPKGHGSKSGICHLLEENLRIFLRPAFIRKIHLPANKVRIAIEFDPQN